MIYKRCPICRKLRRSHLWNLNAYCSEHQQFFISLTMGRWKQSRSITAENLDVFDLQGHRLCRNCGKPLITKTGKFSTGKRTCSPYCRDLITDFIFKHDFNTIAWNLKRKSNQCAKCGLTVRSHQLDAHHIHPVCLTTMNDIESIWDPENIILLCIKCHGQSHSIIHEHHRKIQQLKTHETNLKKGIKPLESFLIK